MISGNVPFNPQALLQPASNATNLNISRATFPSRLVKHGFNLDTVNRRLAEMDKDPERGKLFEEVEKDGGKASFQKLLQRLIKLRPIQTQNSTVSGGSGSQSGGDEKVPSSVVPDGSKPVQQETQGPRPISRPLSIEKGLIPDDLSLNGQFARVGARFPGFLLEWDNAKGETIYQFKNQHSLARIFHK